MKTKLLSMFLIGALGLSGTNWTTFTTNNTNNGGIPENSIVRDVFHAQDGRIWITTTKGISIWNGKNWEYLTTATNNIASPLDNIYDIKVDSKGVMWFTGGGLMKYDGTTWTKYDVSKGFIYGGILDIAIDKDDNIWLATTTGAVHFDGNKWTLFTTNDGLPGNYITCVDIDKKGNVWAGTGSSYFYGVAKYNGSSWTKYQSTNSGLLHNKTTEIEPAPNGDVWIATENGISVFDGTNWTSHVNTLSKEIIPGEINDIVFDNQGNGWLSTSGGVVKYDGTQWKTYDKSNVSQFAVSSSSSIAVTPNGYVWAGFNYYDMGVAKFNGEEWSHYNYENTQNGLYSNDVEELAEDENGKIWIATRNGISAIKDGHWDNIRFPIDKKDNLHHNKFENLGFDKNGNLWASMTSGIIKQNGNNWEILTKSTTPEGLFHSSPWDMHFDRQGRVWCSFYRYAGGATMFDGNEWNKFTSSSTNNQIDWSGMVEFAEAKDGTIWTFTRMGLELYSYDGINWTAHRDYNKTPYADWFSCIDVGNNGKVWIGTESYGIITYDGTDWHVIDKSSTNEGLLSNKINEIKIDSKGNVWVGTSRGLAMFNGISWESHSITENNTFPSNYIKRIFEDSKGNIWVSTDQGLATTASYEINSAKEEPLTSANIYPNPVTNISIVSFEEFIQNGTLILVNSLGQEVSRFSFSGKQTQLAKDELSEGVYIVKVFSENNSTIYSNTIQIK